MPLLSSTSLSHPHQCWCRRLHPRRIFTASTCQPLPIFSALSTFSKVRRIIRTLRRQRAPQLHRSTPLSGALRYAVRAFLRRCPSATLFFLALPTKPTLPITRCLPSVSPFAFVAEAPSPSLLCLCSVLAGLPRSSP